MPKIIHPLTDKECRNARPREKAYKLFSGKGLYLEILPRGGKHWRLKYRIHGKEKRIALGSYPETSLQEANTKAIQERKRCKEGIDPSEHRRKEREAQARAHRNTFEKLAREWHAKYQARWKSEKYAKHVLRRLEIDVFPTLGHRPISAIDAMEVIALLRKIQGRGVGELVRRLKLTIGQVFTYAFLEGIIPGNPITSLKCKDILIPYQRGNYSALGPEELPEFIRTLTGNKARLYPHTLLATEMLIHTFVRTSELIAARWEEFNLESKVWTIPASRMKMGREHLVPLSRQVLEILGELDSHRVKKSHDDFPNYVFPNLINPRNHMSNNTILKALERMGYKGKTTGHGFRATATTTIVQNLGYRYDVVDRQLSHAKGDKIRAAYDRAEFWEERVGMMQKWSDYLDRQAGKRPMLLHLRRFQDEQSARMAS